MPNEYERALGDLVTWIYLAEVEIKAALDKARKVGAPQEVIGRLSMALSMARDAKAATNKEIA